LANYFIFKSLHSYKTKAMLTTIKGIYNNGEITMEEKPKITQPAKVLVTFVEEVEPDEKKKPRKAGYGKGTVTYISPDFDEPLEDLKDYM
jgi:hypothetical protein